MSARASSWMKWVYRTASALVVVFAFTHLSVADDVTPLWTRQIQSLQLVGASGVSPQYAQYVSQVTGTLVTGSVTCTTAATQFPSNATTKFSVLNPTSTNVYLGGSAVTATTSDSCIGTTSTACVSAAVNDINLSNTNQLYCRVATGSQIITFFGVN